MFFTDRYSGPAKGRIITSIDRNNLLYGHWGGRTGVIFENRWIRLEDSKDQMDWKVLCYSNGMPSNANVLLNGKFVSSDSSTGSLSAESGLGINTYPGEESDWEFAELAIWDKALTSDQLSAVQTHMIDKMTKSFNWPTPSPTDKPVSDPTFSPTEKPVAHPSQYPTIEPTGKPFKIPEPTQEPIAHPTLQPSREPSFSPTDKPVSSPSFHPTREPIAEPTDKPITLKTETPTTVIVEKLPDVSPSSIKDDVPRGLELPNEDSAVVDDNTKPIDYYKSKIAIEKAQPLNALNYCEFLFIKGTSSEVPANGCVLIFAEDFKFLKNEETSAAIYMCAKEGKNIGLTSSKLHNLMGEGEANAVTYVLPGKHCTARIFQNDNYQGLNKNLTSSFHLPLFQIYFGSEKKNAQANDRTGSILIETKGETDLDWMPNECRV